LLGARSASRCWPISSAALRASAGATTRGSRLRALSAGFTLLEVMIGLALLGLALVVLIKSAAGSIFNAEQAHMLGVATDLARGKMYDIEEILLKDGFTDTDQSATSEECFDDEGWPSICYTYKVEQPELPSFDQIQQMAMAQAKGSAAGSGSAALGGFENSEIGGIAGMMGMFGATGQSIDAAQGGALIQQQFQMFQDILKVSVRKVTLTVKWKVLGSDRDLKVVAYFTDPIAMDKVLNGMGAQEIQEAGSGSGSGSGSTPGSLGGTPPGRFGTRGGGSTGASPGGKSP
jgi:general secretion pathway protein I